MSGTINTGGGNVIINVRVNNQQAATAFGQLQTQLQQLRSHTSALDVEFRNIDRTLRYMAAGAIIGLTGALVNLAGELERQTVLLATMEGTFDKANQRMDQLVSLAQKVPYSLSSITDAFTKMKSAGIEPIIDNQGNGPLRNLIDAVAAFGGTEQQLNRATVAIQQMAGKGTVSLEELRQQMGEAVPTAIRAMAAGMGISIAELIDRITRGNVTFREGVNAMLAEFQRSYAGAGELLNNTFLGSIRQLKTELDNLVLSFNRAGGLDIFTAAIRALTGGLREVNAVLTSSTISSAFDSFADWISNNAAQVGLFTTVLGQFGNAVLAIGGFIGSALSAMPADALAGGLIGFVLLGRAGFVVGALLGSINETLVSAAQMVVATVTAMKASGGILGAGAAEIATLGAIGFLLLGRSGLVLAGIFALADATVGLIRKLIATIMADFAGAWEFLKSQFTLGFTSPLTPLENWRKSTEKAEAATRSFMETFTGRGTAFGDINQTPFGEWLNQFNSQTATGSEQSANSVKTLVEQLRAMREQVAANRREFENRFQNPNAPGGPSQADIDAMARFLTLAESVGDRLAGSTGNQIDGWARRMRRAGDAFQETIDRMQQSRLQALDEGRPDEADALARNIAKSQQQLVDFRANIDRVVASESGKIVGRADAALDRFQANMRTIKEEVEAFSATNERGRRSEDAEVQRVEARYAQIQGRIDTMRIAIERSRGSDAEQAASLTQLKQLQDQLNLSRERAIDVAKRKAQWEQEDAQRNMARRVEDAQNQLRREQLGMLPGGELESDIIARRSALQNSIRQVDDQIREMERRLLETGGKDTWVTQWLENLRRVRAGFEQLYNQVGTFAEREALRSKKFFDDIGKSLEDSFARGLETLITGTGSLKEVFNSLFNDISRSVSRYLTSMLFQEAGAAGGGGTGGMLSSAFGSIAGALFGGAGGGGGTFSLGKAIGSIFGGADGGGLKAALGKVFEGGQVKQFAAGGAFSNRVVSGPTLFNIGEMGEKGPEAIMPLMRVGGRLGVASAGGGNSYSISISAVDAASVRDLFYREGGALVGSLQQRTRLNRGLR